MSLIMCSELGWRKNRHHLLSPTHPENNEAPALHVQLCRTCTLDSESEADGRGRQVDRRWRYSETGALESAVVQRMVSWEPLHGTANLSLLPQPVLPPSFLSPSLTKIS